MPEVNFRCIIFLCSALPLSALPSWDRSYVLSYPLSLGYSISKNDSAVNTKIEI